MGLSGPVVFLLPKNNETTVSLINSRQTKVAYSNL